MILQEVGCPECGEFFEVDGPEGLFVHMTKEHPESIQARVAMLAMDRATRDKG